MTDWDIIHLIQKDKDAGIKELFDKYYRPLVAYANTYTRDLSWAEDIVQEFYLRLWKDKYLQTIQTVALPSYMYTSVRNSCKTFISKNDVLRYSQNIRNIEIPVENLSVIDEYRLSVIRKEMEDLPLQTRHVIECVVLKGLKYREAAEELNISVNTLKTLLKSGMKRLRENMAQYQSYFFMLLLKFRSSRKIY